MLELILSAIGLGFMLSLVFMETVFFLLIETSFCRGHRHALALDLGVITADILCIVAAYFASADLVELIDKHPGFYRITALIILVYGIFMMLAKLKCTLLMRKNHQSKLFQNLYKWFLVQYFECRGYFILVGYRNFGERNEYQI
ncbi:MAG: hypothetical protein U0T85_06125 [Cloacibacterium normanense]